MQIDIRLSKRLEKINPSSTLAITAKAKKLKSQGCDIVNFAAGEPDFDTPDFIKDAAITAIKTGFTKYTPTTGIPELKKLISEKLRKDNFLEYDSSQIVVSCGAKHSIFNTLMVLVNKGEEVLIPSPYWLSYPEMVNLCEGRPRFIKTLPENNFKIKIRDLEKNINSKTKLIILNSPSNPTGCLYAEGELNEISGICAAKNIFVISDEIYEKIIYDGLKHVSIASLGKGIYDRTITINGLSKSYSMTGWRIGYLAAPQPIVDAVSNLQDHSTSNPASISQKAAVAALQAPDDFSELITAEFQKRRDFAIERLSKIKRISFVKPNGAFYIFCDISNSGLNSLTFANRLLDEAYVSLIPGAAFGRDDYVRISFATNILELEKGINRIEQWLNKV